MKKFNRCLSLLLSLLMIMTMVPMSLVQTAAASLGSDLSDNGDVAELGANVEVAATSWDQSAVTVYFNAASWSVNTIYLLIGHSTYSTCYKFTRVAGTVYKCDVPAWDGATEWYIINADSGWGDESSSPTHRKEYATNASSMRTSALMSGKLYTPTGSQTLTSQAKVGAVYSSGTDGFTGGITGGTATLKGVNPAGSAVNVVTVSEALVGGTLLNTTTVTVTAQANIGYEFTGWYSSPEGGTCVSTKDTYSFVLNANKTLYARFMLNLPEGLKYEIADGEVTITGYTGSATAINIPSVIEGCPVTKIESSAFYECSSLESITLPKSITSIGYGAFRNTAYYNNESNWQGGVLYIGTALIEAKDSVSSYYDVKEGTTVIAEFAFERAYALESVTIPDSVAYINDYAFYYSSISSIRIPAGVKTIGEKVFNCCSSLASIVVDEGNTVYDSRGNCNAIIETATDTIITGCKNTEIPNGVTAIGENAFEECHELTKIVIPGSVTSIGDSAFDDCSSLSEIVIPDSVTSIGSFAFSYCYSLSDITIPDSLMSLGCYAFSGTAYYNNAANWQDNVLYIDSALIEAKDTISDDYDIKEGTTIIAGRAFWDCGNLTGVTIPNGVKSIGEQAFYGCLALENLTIPDSMISIEKYAFHECAAIDSITIPDSVTYIGKGAFGYCESVESITVDKNNTVYDSRDNCNAIIETATDTLITGCKNTVISKDVTDIAGYAFAGCTGLESLIIPDGVTSIGDTAFSGCTSLKNINIPDGVTCINDLVFFYCSALESIVIPEGVTRIGHQTFDDCSSLKTVTIPASVTSIDYYGFSDCPSITDVYYGGTPEQWEVVEFGQYNEDLTSANIHYEVDIFTVKFVDYDGTVLRTQQVPTGASATAPEVPTRTDGWIFDKWDKDFSCITGDLMVEAQYKDDNVYLMGIDRGWSMEDCYVMEPSDGNTVTCTIRNLPTATTYEFKFLYEDVWYTDVNAGTVVNSTEDSWWSTTDNQSLGNTKLIAAGGTYVVTFNKTDKTFKIEHKPNIYEVTFNYYGETYLEPITTTVQVEAGGDVELPVLEERTDRWFYLFWAESVDGEPYGTRYTQTVTNVTQDMTIQAWYFDDNAYLVGNVIDGQWFRSQENMLEVYDFEKGTSSKTIHLEPGQYEFKVIHRNDGSMMDYFYGNNGTINDSCYNWDMSTVAKNCVLNASGGTYTFTFDRKTKQLSVAYIPDCYTVTFVDEDGTTVLSTQQVTAGTSATAPEVKTVGGLEFYAWDKDFSNVQSDLTVTAIRYNKNVQLLGDGAIGGWTTGTSRRMTYNSNGTNTKTITLPAGRYELKLYTEEWGDWLGNNGIVDDTTITTSTEGWDMSTGANNLTLNASGGKYTFTFNRNTKKLSINYSPIIYTVKFVNWDGSTLSTQTVNIGESAVPPETVPVREGYRFIGWNKVFTNVLSNLTVCAVFEKLDYDGLDYSIANGEVTITDYIGTASVLVIPDEIEGYPVTGIDVEAFYNCASLVKVTIPTSVTNIYINAFNECPSLTDVYYDGTQAQWGKISIEEGNGPLTNATLHFNEEQYKYVTISIVGGTISTEPQPNGRYLKYNELIVVASEAPAGQKFAYWTDAEGNIISYDEQYKSYPVNNTRFVAVFVDEDKVVEKKPLVHIYADPIIDIEKINYTISWEVDESVGEVTSAGVVFVNKSDYNPDTFCCDSTDPNVTVYRRGSTAQKNTFSIGKTGVLYNNTYCAATFVTYTDARTGGSVTVYSSVNETYMPAPSVETVTIYFTNNLITYWDSELHINYKLPNETEAVTVEMTDTDTNAFGQVIYCAEIPENATEMWFTDGSGNISEVITEGIVDNAGYYLASKTSGYWMLVPYNYNPNSITIYYENVNKWDYLYVHYWGEQATEWPGVQMELYGVNARGNDVYTYTVPGGTVGLVFNNGEGDQSCDITQGIEDNVCFSPSDSSGWGTGSTVINPDSLAPIIKDLYLRGTFNDWGITNPMTEQEDGSWVAEIELKAGNYEFKLGTENWKICYPSSVSDNVVLNASVDGVYKITLNTDKTVSYIGPDAYIPEQIVNVIALSEIGKISLSWSESSEVKTDTYRIYRKAEDESEYSLIKTINNRKTLTFEDKNVEKNKTYSYYVTGVGLYNIESEPSLVTTATVLTDVTAPTVLKLTPSDKSIIWGNTFVSVTATDNIGVTKVTYYYSTDDGNTWTLIGETSGGRIALSTADIAVETVKVKAVAYDAEGNESAPLVYTYTIDNAGPDKVTDVSAVSLPAKLTLSWKDVKASDASYFVLQKKSGDGWVIVASNIKTLGYNVSDLDPDTEYTFRVVCVDVRGNTGEYSDEITVKTLVDNTAPVITSLSPAPARYNSSINFSAVANDDCDIYEIEIQTSDDAQDWETVSTKTYDSRASKQTYSYKFNLDDYDEGSLYVRAIATDYTGNVSDTSEKAPYTEYIVDRTAPAKPENVTANGNEGYITIAWSIGQEMDLNKYTVYRATSADGTYTAVASNLSTVNYHDRNVQENTEYYYKVCVADTCGNVSEFSDVVSATMSPDEKKPVITGISTTYEQKISNNMNTIKITANDNNKLAVMVVEYSTSKKMEYTELVRYTGINNSYKNASVILPLEGLEDGDILYLRAYCVDMAGLQSAYATSNYTVDNTAPHIKDLKADADGSEITLSWNDCRESDLSGFKVYRSSDGENFKLLGSRGVKSSGSYTFVDTITATQSGTYTYRVEAIDRVGNTSSQSTTAEYTYTYVYVNTPPTINLSTPGYMTVGVEEIFDATGSKDNMGVLSYLWDFGDGTTSTDQVAVKKYQETGTYTVTLTVEDNEGLSASETRIVEVKERDILGTLNVKVLDDTGKALSFVPVYFDLGNENQQIIQTNASGVATMAMSAGKHVIGMYTAGYLPVKKEVVVLANATRTVTLTTVEDDIVTGNFEVTRMTFEEIVAAGIDVYDPANQNVYSAKVRVTYASTKQPLQINYVRNDSQILSYTVTDTSGNPVTQYTNNNGETRKIVSVTYIPSGGSTKTDVVAILDIPAQASYLKEFFDVRLHIVNNAASEFVIENNEVVLNVPEGMTLMDNVTGGYLTSNIAHFDSIKGQETVTLAWVLRGDKAGEYDLSADFTGTLAEFNELVTARFETDEPIKVYGLEGVKFRILTADEIHNDTLYFNIELENERDIDIYMPTIGFTDKVENVTASTLNDSADDDFFTDAYILNAYVQYEDGNKLYLPVTFDSNGRASTPIEVLAPGQKLVYEYVAYNAINYNGIAYFKEAAIKEFEGIIENIEVGSFHKVRYSFTDYSNKLDNLLAGTDAQLQAAYNHIMNSDAYYYVGEAESIGNSICEGLYDTLALVLKGDISSFTQSEQRTLIEKTILDLFCDPSVVNMADELTAAKYNTAVAKVIDDVEASLIQDYGDNEDTLGEIGELAAELIKDSDKLTEIYMNDGYDALLTHISQRIAGYTIASAVDVVSLVGPRTEYIDIATVFDYGTDVISGFFEAASEAEQDLVFYSILNHESNAQTAMYVLDAIIKYTEKDAAEFMQEALVNHLIMPSMGIFMLEGLQLNEKELLHVVALEMKWKLQKNVDESIKEISLFLNFIENGLEATAEVAASILLKKFLGATPYGLIMAGFALIDAAFGWENYTKQIDTMQVYNEISEALKKSFVANVENRNIVDDSYSMLFLMGLCETRLMGESQFYSFMEDYKNGVYLYKRGDDEVLKRVNKAMNANYQSLDEWWDDVQYNIVHSRDIMFNVEGLSTIIVPDAPIVSLNYETLETNQEFSDEYEYCFADGTWKPCTGETIKFEVKGVPGTLRVRKAASANSVAGEIKTVKIFARKDLSKLITVKFDGRNYQIDNLKPGYSYQVYFANASNATPDWSVAKTVIASNSTAAIYGVSEYDYVIIRSAQNSMNYETTSNPLVRTVQKKHVLDLVIDGSGTVSQTSSTGTYFNGESIDLVASAMTGAEFVGWYINNQCVSTDTFYIAEMDNGMEITAKFTGAKIVSVDVVQLPQKLTYLESEELDTKGIKVVATYDNGATAEVSDFTAVVTSGLVGTSNVVVDFGGKKSLFEITIEHDDTGWITVSEAAPGEDGYRYKACYACHSILDEETEHIAHLSFSGASLTLSDNLAINFKVKASLFSDAGYENPYVVFDLNGVKTTVSEYTVSDDKYVFTFRDIAPSQMNDIVYATLYADYEGEEFMSSTVSYSVEEYCYSVLDIYNTDAYAELRTLLVDLLNYGAASQCYTDYKTDDLVNADLTDEQKLWGTETVSELNTVLNTKYEVVDNPTAKWKGAGLALNDAVSMRFKFTADDIEGLSVKIRTDYYEWTIPSEEFVEDNGVYVIYFNELGAGNMRDTVYLTICDGNKAVSNTVVYSIESYACEKQNSTIPYLADLVKAMMKYGDAAYAYVN